MPTPTPDDILRETCIGTLWAAGETLHNWATEGGMKKIVINRSYGGFGFSREAELRLGPAKTYENKRDDPKLVSLVEELGDAASGQHSRLKVVEIPADVEWEINEYDGHEWVAEKHRTWPDDA